MIAKKDETEETEVEAGTVERIALGVGRDDQHGLFWTFTPVGDCPHFKDLYPLACPRDQVQLSDGIVVAWGLGAVTLGRILRMSRGFQIVDKPDAAVQ